MTEIHHSDLAARIPVMEMVISQRILEGKRRRNNMVANPDDTDCFELGTRRNDVAGLDLGTLAGGAGEWEISPAGGVKPDQEREILHLGAETEDAIDGERKTMDSGTAILASQVVILLDAYILLKLPNIVSHPV
jgi:hypothetical protein